MERAIGMNPICFWSDKDGFTQNSYASHDRGFCCCSRCWGCRNQHGSVGRCCDQCRSSVSILESDAAHLCGKGQEWTAASWLSHRGTFALDQEESLFLV